MKLKLLVTGLALAASMMVHADPMGSVGTVTPGVWGNNFAASKEYADRNNIPMLVFWANPGCSQCEKMEKACNEADFKAWQEKQQLVMVFGYGANTPDLKECKTFAKNSSKTFPYVAVYWKANAQGQEVLERFTGRSGKIGYGTSSKVSLQQQVMDAVDLILDGWNPLDPVTPGPVEPGPVEPTMYTVTFVVDTEKATYSGSLVQKVEKNKAATAPTVTAKDGWMFTGWSSSFSKVTADITVTAMFTEKPDPGDPEVNVKEVFKKTRSISALVYDEADMCGTATFSIGKINAKKQTVKVTAKISLFTGKSLSASVTKVPEKNGSIAGELKFKAPVGSMDFELTYDAEENTFAVAAENDSYSMEQGDVVLGGPFESTELSFGAEFEDLEFPEGYDSIVDAPSGEPVYVKNGTKLSCDKVPSIKYKKFSEDGEKWYELVIDDKDGEKTNYSGLKISYTAKTGVFKGSFYVYASNEFDVEDGKKPTLKKYSAKFNGVVVNGIGVGRVTIKIGKLSYTGTCSLY